MRTQFLLATCALLFLFSQSLVYSETPYIQAVIDAQKARTIRNDSTFQGLTVINSSKTRTLTVDDGAGGTKTIQAVNVITFTNFTAPYAGATNLQRYVVDAAGNFRSNLWTTVEGDTKAYFRKKHI